MTPQPTAGERRARIADASVMLIFTPQYAGARDPLEVLDEVLESVDVVQVRAKNDSGESEAREQQAWTRRVLELCRAREAKRILVLVNDRVDVARSLQTEGCDGVHLGQDDCRPELARELLGPDALIGLSTHDFGQVVHGAEEPVDYLGFGPVFPTATKGYESGVGVEAAWVASSAVDIPVFPIGGIDTRNVSEFANIGRAAVCSAILASPEPRRAADMLRNSLASE